ncbi:MAG TPA: hypothetical protein PKE63_09990 [Lacibacter sp.]|nr:hypothetical protein [Lacibacter sp.]HMO88002.1 hypothetical protein [Lacibacter sp.]HMP87597.1 hypothetical protein [Lacibacter sp.]
MQEPAFTPSDSLQLIEEMIQKAQGRFSDNGHLYLLWGWVILLCSSTSFVLVHFFHSFTWLNAVWMLTLPTMVYQMIYLARHRNKKRVKTYTDEINNFVWVVFVIMGFLTGVVVGRSGHPELLNPMILVLYGMPTFLSGVILRFLPLRIGALSCWALALLAVFLPVSYSFLLIALAVIAAWIVPGYLLRSQFKQQESHAGTTHL